MNFIRVNEKIIINLDNVQAIVYQPRREEYQVFFQEEDYIEISAKEFEDIRQLILPPDHSSELSGEIDTGKPALDINLKHRVRPMYAIKAALTDEGYTHGPMSLEDCLGVSPDGYIFKLDPCGSDVAVYKCEYEDINRKWVWRPV